MIDKDKLREEFSKRLNLALDNAGVREHGRGVDIQNELKRKGLKASTESIRKWLSGISIPGVDNMKALAEFTNVPISWLQFGEGDISSTSNELTYNHHNNIKVVESYIPSAKPFSYPILAWDDVEKFMDKRLSSNKFGGALMSSINIKSGFWIEVTGDAMWSSGRITFPSGSMILIDPDYKKLESGKFYIVKLKDGTMTFKQLIRDAGMSYLKSLNENYKPIPINESECEFLGLVVDRDLGKLY